jgi:hypothetical protein
MAFMPGRIGSFTFDRRRLLQSVLPGLFGFGTSTSQARSALATTLGTAPRTAAARNVLVVYEEGGMSQMDTWDPKPEAPVDHRSPYQPIATNVPGIQLSSLMPNLARHVDKLSIVRSMTSARVAGHMEGCREFFKGYRFDSTVKFPDIGSVVVERLGTDCPELPGYVFAPGANMPNHVSNPGFLKADRAPWKLGTKNLGENVAAPDWRVKALDPQPELNAERLASRRALLSQMNDSPAEADAAMLLRRSYLSHAFDMLTSPQVRAALSFRGETEATLDRYGRDHRGLCYLLGRKLVEAGVRFVCVTVIQPPDLVGRPNYGEPNGVFLNWDHHEGIYRNGPCGGPQGMSNQERYGLPHPIMMPSFDRSFSALLEDLDQRGLLDETLVCYVTEMGRTPRVNKWGGRDHWGRAGSIAFAGAGVPGGQVVGRTDREAADVVEARYTPYDFAETVYRKLGIDTEQRLRLPDGRPIDFTDGGRPMVELF